MVTLTSHGIHRRDPHRQKKNCKKNTKGEEVNKSQGHHLWFYSKLNTGAEGQQQVRVKLTVKPYFNGFKKGCQTTAFCPQTELSR